MDKWKVYRNDSGRWIAQNGSKGYPFSDQRMAFRFAEIQATAEWMKVS